MKSLLCLCLLSLVLAISPAQQVSVTPVATGVAIGTTASVGGSLLAIGTPATGTASLTGPTIAAGRPCIAAPSDGTSLTVIGSGLGLTVGCAVTSSNTATVYVNVSVAGTPSGKTYAVVAFP